MVNHTRKEKMDDRDKYVLLFGDSELIRRRVFKYPIQVRLFDRWVDEGQIKKITGDEASSNAIFASIKLVFERKK